MGVSEVHADLQVARGQYIIINISLFFSALLTSPLSSSVNGLGYYTFSRCLIHSHNISLIQHGLSLV